MQRLGVQIATELVEVQNVYLSFSLMKLYLYLLVSDTCNKRFLVPIRVIKSAQTVHILWSYSEKENFYRRLRRLNRKFNAFYRCYSNYRYHRVITASKYWITDHPINFIEQGHSVQADSSSTSHNISTVYTSLTLIPILSHINPILFWRAVLI